MMSSSGLHSKPNRTQYMFGLLCDPSLPCLASRLSHISCWQFGCHHLRLHYKEESLPLDLEVSCRTAVINMWSSRLTGNPAPRSDHNQELCLRRNQKHFQYKKGSSNCFFFHFFPANNNLRFRKFPIGLVAATRDVKCFFP